MQAIPEHLVMPKTYSGREGEAVRAAVFGNDADVGIEFRIHSEFRAAKSEVLGFPVYEDVEMIIYHVDRWTKIPELVNDGHRRKYAELYQRFKQGLGSLGTAISTWEMASPSERNMIEAQGLITVEQFAEVSDAKLAALPNGFKELRDKARKHVEVKSGKINASEYGEEILRLKREIETLKAAAVEQAEKKPRGRPKKAGKTEENLEDATESNSTN